MTYYTCFVLSSICPVISAGEEVGDAGEMLACAAMSWFVSRCPWHRSTETLGSRRERQVCYLLLVLESHKTWLPYIVVTQGKLTRCPEAKHRCSIAGSGEPQVTAAWISCLFYGQKGRITSGVLLFTRKYTHNS